MKIEFMTKTELKEEIMYLKCDVEAKQKCINDMDKYIKELKDENKHSNNYIVHSRSCSWLKNGNGICDCGLIKTNKKIVC